MACKCVGRKDLVERAINKLEQIFLFNSEDQAEIGDDLNALLKDHPRDGEWRVPPGGLPAPKRASL